MIVYDKSRANVAIEFSDISAIDQENVCLYYVSSVSGGMEVVSNQCIWKFLSGSYTSALVIYSLKLHTFFHLAQSNNVVAPLVELLILSEWKKDS